MPHKGKIISEERLAQLRLAAQKGGLAKRGKMSVRKLNEMKKKAAIQQRAMQLADKSLNSVAVAAFGSYILARVDIDEKTNKKRLIPVHEVDEIADLMSTGDLGVDYFILEGTAPDWKAAVEIIERGIGKVAENKKVDVEHHFNLTGLAKERAKLAELEAPQEPIHVPARVLEAP